MNVNAFCLAAVLALSGCSGEGDSANSEEHFAKDQKTALDKASAVGATLEGAAATQKKASE